LPCRWEEREKPLHLWPPAPGENSLPPSSWIIAIRPALPVPAERLYIDSTDNHITGLVAALRRARSASRER